MHKGEHLSNRFQSYFVTDLDIYCDSSKPAKKYNYNQHAVIQMSRNESHNRHIDTNKINVYIRLPIGFNIGSSVP